MKKTEEKMVRKRRSLTPETKYQICLEATMVKAKGNGSISEVFRRWGIHSSNLTWIRVAVEKRFREMFFPSSEKWRSQIMKQTRGLGSITK